MLGDELWLEAAVPVAGNLDGQFAKLALESLTALAVTGVSCGVGNRPALGVTEMGCHFGF